MPKVHEFAPIPSLHVETQLYTQRRSSGESPANYRFTLEELTAFLIDQFDLVQIKGAYASDEAAAIGGVAVNEWYELTEGNIWGMPEGLAKKRTS